MQYFHEMFTDLHEICTCFLKKYNFHDLFEEDSKTRLGIFIKNNENKLGIDISAYFLHRCA